LWLLRRRVRLPPDDRHAAPAAETCSLFANRIFLLSHVRPDGRWFYALAALVLDGPFVTFADVVEQNLAAGTDGLSWRRRATAQPGRDSLRRAAPSANPDHGRRTRTARGRRRRYAGRGGAAGRAVLTEYAPASTRTNESRCAISGMKAHVFVGNTGKAGPECYRILGTRVPYSTSAPSRNFVRLGYA
jgi:hypothetical protein